MCTVESERDPSGIRASGQLLNYRSTSCWFRRYWFHLCWFRRCFVFRRWLCRDLVFRRWCRWCNVNRIAFAMFWICPRKFRLRPLWWLHKSSGFYSCRPPHCPCKRFFSRVFAAPEAYKRGRLSNGYITMKLNKTPFSYCSRHN